MEGGRCRGWVLAEAICEMRGNEWTDQSASANMPGGRSWEESILVRALLFILISSI